MKVEEYLKEKGIEFKSFKHEAVFTCEQAENTGIYEQIKGIHSKNLFLKERKSKRFYLVVMPADKPLDLDDLGKKLGDKIKFANEENLKEILGLTKGSVSPFGLINDNKHKTLVIIDKKVWDSEFVCFHPNRNTATVELTGKDFQKYLKGLGNKLEVMEV